MKKVLLTLMTLLMCTGIALYADEKAQEELRMEAFNAVNKQLIQEMNVTLLNIQLFSRRMPMRYYSSEIAAVEAASMQTAFTVRLHDRNSVLKSELNAKQAAEILTPRPVEVAKGFYDRASKQVMVQLNGKAVPPAVFIKALLDKTI